MLPSPAAYLRRSHASTHSPGDVSREAQRATIRRLATADGHDPDDLIEYDDWGVSADIAKADRRTDFLRLLADIEAGRVSDVYAHDPDRLYRDPEDMRRLQRAAALHRVPIRTGRGSLTAGDGDDPDGEFSEYINALMSRREVQMAKKRARAAIAARHERGDDFGHAPVGFRAERGPDKRIVHVPDPEQAEYVATILGAVREAGNILGAVKLLNQRGVPAPEVAALRRAIDSPTTPDERRERAEERLATAADVWHASPLRRIVTRLDPSLLPPRGATGRRVHGRSALAQIIRCHCGKTLTPNVARGQLYCYRATRDGVKEHGGRGSVTEAALMPWIKREAKRLAPPMDAVTDAPEQVAERREAVEARLRRAYAAHIEGGITDETLAAEKSRAAADLAAIEAEQTVLAEVPQAIDWTAPPESINRVLRVLWDHVQLDREMQPVEAVWRLPKWRGPKRPRSRSA